MNWLLVFKGGGSCSRGHEFEAQCRTLDGLVFTIRYLFDVKMYRCLKRPKIKEKGSLFSTQSYFLTTMIVSLKFVVIKLTH